MSASRKVYTECVRVEERQVIRNGMPFIQRVPIYRQTTVYLNKEQAALEKKARDFTRENSKKKAKV